MALTITLYKLLAVHNGGYSRASAGQRELQGVTRCGVDDGWAAAF
jgi:hypothetical protein